MERRDVECGVQTHVPTYVHSNMRVDLRERRLMPPLVCPIDLTSFEDIFLLSAVDVREKTKGNEFQVIEISTEDI